LLDRVESLAQAHAAHAQLFELCEFWGDQGRLHEHMAIGGMIALHHHFYPVHTTPWINALNTLPLKREELWP